MNRASGDLALLALGSGSPDDAAWTQPSADLAASLSDLVASGNGSATTVVGQDALLQAISDASSASDEAAAVEAVKAWRIAIGLATSPVMSAD